MLPEIGSIGPFVIHSYGLSIAIGVFLAIFLMMRSARRAGFPPSERVFDMVFAVVLGGFLGARLFYVLQEWDGYREHPLEMVQIWKGGLIYYGGVLGSFAGFFFYVRAARLPFLKSCDFVLPYVPFVHSFGRVGCFLNGCCYGKPSSLPWAVLFPALSERVHPAQLYESFFNLGLFGFLVWLYPRRQFTGQTTFLYLILYPIGRFLNEFLRGDNPAVIGFLTFPQGVSLVFFLVGVSLYGIYRLRSRSQKTPR